MEIKYSFMSAAVWVLCIFLQVSSAAQLFEKGPDYTEVNPGHEAGLTCKIFSRKGQCSWQKDNKPVGIYLGKYEWSGNVDSGDCSIRIKNATLEYDDGEWECQVTASDFMTQDALTSKPVKLVVRVPPNAPQLEYNGTIIPMGKNLTCKSGLKSYIKCTSRYGNPPPKIKWFVGDSEVTVGTNQTNKTEDDSPKKWVATSILEHTFSKAHNGKFLRCVAVHEAFPTKSRDTQIILNIQYPPQVKVVAKIEGDLEEHKNNTILRCAVDANPPAHIIWKKSGSATQIFSYEEIVELKPLLREHSGSYHCEAKNSLGTAVTANIEIDVKYPPKITSIGPDINATLYSRANLHCKAEGNPQPAYKWVQKLNEGTIQLRGNESSVLLQNLTYEYQGKYICIASNVISGAERNVQSQPTNLVILGGPQVLAHTIEREIIIQKGSEAILIINFCSNPLAFKTVWNWGSIQLEPGHQVQRFTAEEIRPGSRDHCFEAKLRVANADSSDSRHYYLSIANSLGNSKFGISLQVRDPISMKTVVGTIIACLVLLVAIVLLILYAFKTEKWCFSQRGDFKPSDLESEKSDVVDGGNSLRKSGSHGHGNGQMTFIMPPEGTSSIRRPSPAPKRPPPDPDLPPPPAFPRMKQPNTNGNELDRRHNHPSSKSGINYKNHPRYLEHHPSQIPRRIEYAEIQFKPKANEQAEL